MLRNVRPIRLQQGLPASSCAAVPGSPGTATPLDSIYELGILQHNGPTQTVALVPPSSLIDGAALCVGPNNVFLKTDRRGNPRPSNGRCDIDAFEYNEIFAGTF